MRNDMIRIQTARRAVVDPRDGGPPLYVSHWLETEDAARAAAEAWMSRTTLWARLRAWLSHTG